MALLSACMLLYTTFEIRKERTSFENLSQAVFPKDDTPETSTSEPQKPLPDRRNDTEAGIVITHYAALEELNSDFAGWLKIPGTEIDYPVMCTPDEPEYYLHRAFDKTRSISGTPFIGEGASMDSDCVIIHGHNMKDDTMFGSLDKYEDPAFWKDQRMLVIDTLNGRHEYEVFAVVKAEISETGIGAIPYYQYSGALDEQRFNELVEGLQGNALYDTDVQPVYGDQIVMLSTCSYHTENGRLIVAAKERKQKNAGSISESPTTFEP